MRPRDRAILVGLVASAMNATVACNPEPSQSSSDVSTLDMSLYVTLDGDGHGTTHVETTLLGPFGPVDMVDGDAFVVTAPSGPITLRDGPYGEKIGDAPVPDGELHFDVVRPSDRSAHVVVTTPPDFTLSVLPPAGPLVPLRWTAASGAWTTTLTLQGECIHGFSTQLGSDTGSYEVDGRALQGSGACILTATVERHASGTIEQFGGPWGSYDSKQTRSASFSWSAP